jgi:hypothetical protein
MHPNFSPLIEDLPLAYRYRPTMGQPIGLVIRIGLSSVRDELNRLQVERERLAHEQTQVRCVAPRVAEVIAKAIQQHDKVVQNLERLLSEKIPEAREILKQLFGGRIELLPKNLFTIF